MCALYIVEEDFFQISLVYVTVGLPFSYMISFFNESFCSISDPFERTVIKDVILSS